MSRSLQSEIEEDDSEGYSGNKAKNYEAKMNAFKRSNTVTNMRFIQNEFTLKKALGRKSKSGSRVGIFLRSGTKMFQRSELLELEAKQKEEDEETEEIDMS